MFTNERQTKRGMSVGLAAVLVLVVSASVNADTFVWAEEGGNGGQGQTLIIEHLPFVGTQTFTVSFLQVSNPALSAWSMTLSSPDDGVTATSAVYTGMYDLTDPIVLGSSPGNIATDLGQFNVFSVPQFSGGLVDLTFDINDRV